MLHEACAIFSAKVTHASRIQYTSRTRKIGVTLEEKPNTQNIQQPYGENDTPYYEYSSLGQPPPQMSPPQSIQPVPPVQQTSIAPPVPSVSFFVPPVQRQQASFSYPQPMAQPVTPPTRRNRRTLPLLLGGGGLVLVLLLVALVALSSVFSTRTVKIPTPSGTTPSSAPIVPTSSFHSAACPFQLGAGMIDGQTVKCGYVTVPENRQKPTGATVQLPVAIFKALNVENDPLPVLRLEGGPGGPSLDNWAHYVSTSNYSRFVFNHDLIMFDQRGTGYATPLLKCSETQKLQYDLLNTRLNAKDAERLQLQALQTCHDRLIASNVDLNAFNSLENAADVHDLIVALGYKQANLYGVSYGTRLALTAMRLYPSVIHSVVLDSVYPPQRNRTDLPTTAQRVFATLFQGCAADTHCNGLYPHLDTVFYQLVTQLNANPVHFQTTDNTTGKSYTVVMAGDDFVFVLFSALYGTQLIPVLPKMIFQVRDHNNALLSQIYGLVEFDDTFSDGMFYSHECNEDWPFVKQEDINAAVQGIVPQIQPALRASLQQEYDVCHLWNVEKAPAVQKQAVVSAIPTLVLSDEYDPITPPVNGKLAAQTLKNSYYFLFPGLGHGAEYNSTCVNSIISAFDDAPTQKPSDACIATMHEPSFI